MRHLPLETRVGETRLRATVCDVEEITHRQMRNESGAVLRRIAAGETILVTNHGRPAAVIGPPAGDVVSLLSARGEVREAVEPTASLRSIRRRRSTKTTAEIVADVRGPW